MRHHNTNRKFGRERNARRALLRSLAVSLISAGRIKTTEAKAKELRPYVEKLVTIGRRPTLATERLLIARLGQQKSVNLILKEISPRYKERPGGYTRLTKLPPRRSDGSPMSFIEFV